MKAESVSVKEFMELQKVNDVQPIELEAGERMVNATEYAKSVGMNPITVREQIKVGLIAGRKVGGQYMVKLKEPQQKPGDDELVRLRTENAELKLRLQLIRTLMDADENIV